MILTILVSFHSVCAEDIDNRLQHDTQNHRSGIVPLQEPIEKI